MHAARSRSRNLLLWLVLLTISGCATSTPLSKQAREATRSVSISKTVPLSPDLYYIGQGQAVSGTILGPFGAAIAAAAEQGPKGQLKVAMQQASIDVRRIIRDRFKTDLTTAGIFPTIVEDGADAEIKLEVRMYGFVHAPFSTALKPVLGVRSVLVRKDGTVIWEKYDQVWTSNGDTPTRPLPEYLEDPARIEDGFTQASKVVVGTFMKDLRGQ